MSLFSFSREIVYIFIDEKLPPQPTYQSRNNEDGNYYISALYVAIKEEY